MRSFFTLLLSSFFLWLPFSYKRSLHPSKSAEVHWPFVLDVGNFAYQPELALENENAFILRLRSWLEKKIPEAVCYL